MQWRSTTKWLLPRFYQRLSCTQFIHQRFGIGSSAREVRLILAFGLIAFPIALLNNIWVTYNYPFFVTGILADSQLFLLVQGIFLIWNSVNDPLFGWLSDHTKLLSNTDHSYEPIDPSNLHHVSSIAPHPCLRRIRHIKYAAYLLGGAFLFAWFPWSSESRPIAAVHFFVSLCFYDGALTYMEVNYSSLLADLSSNAQTRAYCNSAASLFSILGSFSSFFAHLLYSSSNSTSGPSNAFRLFCACMVALAIPAVEIAVRIIREWARTQTQKEREMEIGRHSPIESPSHDHRPPASSSSPAASTAAPITDNGVSIVHIRVAPTSEETEPSVTHSSTSTTEATLNASPTSKSNSKSKSMSDGDLPPASLTFQLFVRQLLSHRNFSLFCCLRLLQVFLCTFEKNHLSSFLDILLSDFVSTSTRGLLISMSFILPHLLLLITSLYQTELGGVYSIIKKLFTTKILSALLMLAGLAWGTSGGLTQFSSSTLLPYFLLLYLCGSRVVTECVCRLFPLVVANLVDEDRVLHLRPSSMAATLIGTSSLLAKPGESLAPMLGWKVLNSVIDADSTDMQINDNHSATSPIVHSSNRKQALLYLLLILPLVSVTLQLVLWSFFTLRDSYLKRIQQRIQLMEQEGMNDVTVNNQPITTK